ncbi:hypothetical protein E1B28_004919 [Marasmius oreades]|uniref:Uncharacterized protein n=1 Tax=Marasmius oreades TaxID=181124 RepID=A0A9P7UZM8_9AGAR|nr:uncharacterized protein E1B28_004919 [Marasmius oreades]KAG7097582.1 hypothetical protein E1B28_004919 [Marasmius oreades]
MDDLAARNLLLEQAPSVRESAVKQEASRLEGIVQTSKSHETALEKQQDEFMVRKSKCEETWSAKDESLSKREEAVRSQEEKLALDLSNFEHTKLRRENELKLREADVVQKEAELRSRSIQSARIFLALGSRSATVSPHNPFRALLHMPATSLRSESQSTLLEEEPAQEVETKVKELVGQGNTTTQQTQDISNVPQIHRQSLQLPTIQRQIPPL